MTETPTAAVAAPVAPVAPVAAPVAPVAPVVAPAAAVAPVAAPVAPTPPVEISLLDGAAPAAPAGTPQTDAEKLAAAQELVKQAAAAADPNSGKAWLLTEGVMGTGEKPGWFKGDKYKSVAEQAAAYPELEKRFGSFTGSPKDGYKFTPPDGVQVNMEHPVMVEFTKWAKDSQISQAGFDTLLGTLIQYEASNAPDMGKIKASLGADADARISNAVSWVKANLGAEGYTSFSEATKGANAAAVFRTVEALIGKSGQVRMPKAGEDVPGGRDTGGLDAIKRDHGAKMPDGKTLKVNADPNYRLEVDKRYQAYYAAQGQ